jgi:hypothetical protein
LAIADAFHSTNTFSALLLGRSGVIETICYDPKEGTVSRGAVAGTLGVTPEMLFEMIESSIKAATGHLCGEHGPLN